MTNNESHAHNCKCLECNHHRFCRCATCIDTPDAAGLFIWLSSRGVGMDNMAEQFRKAEGKTYTQLDAEYDEQCGRTA